MLQGHPEAGGDAHGTPEKDHDQCPADESAGPQQECAVSARITAELTAAGASCGESINPGL